MVLDLPEERLLEVEPLGNRFDDEVRVAVHRVRQTARGAHAAEGTGAVLGPELPALDCLVQGRADPDECRSGGDGIRVGQRHVRARQGGDGGDAVPHRARADDGDALDHARSTMTAMPWPTPMHIVAAP